MKNIEVYCLLGNDHNESSLDGRIMPIYLISDRIIYWLDNYVYVKKDGKIKRLFKKQKSFADYTDGFDKNNIPLC